MASLARRVCWDMPGSGATTVSACGHRSPAPLVTHAGPAWALPAGVRSSRGLWLECDRLYRRPVELRELVSELAAQVRIYQPGVVCGPVTGGAFLAWEVARVLNTQFRCTVAQSSQDSTDLYSTVYRLSDPAELVDARVVVVDDVINAGSAVRSTLEKLTAAASKPIALAALLGPGEPVEDLARVSDRP
jgi:orotate phosphoribosyltransferase